MAGRKYKGVQILDFVTYAILKSNKENENEDNSTGLLDIVLDLDLCIPFLSNDNYVYLSKDNVVYVL